MFDINTVLLAVLGFGVLAVVMLYVVWRSEKDGPFFDDVYKDK